MKANPKRYVSHDVMQQELARLEAKMYRLHAGYIERQHATTHGASIAAQATTKYGRKRRKGKGPDATAKGEPSRV